MKRLWITLAVVALAATTALPAAAGAPDFCDPESPKYNPDHQTCKADDSTTTTTTHPSGPEVCEFVSGELVSWTPPDFYQCQWTIPVDERDKTFHFTLTNGSPDATVNMPHLIVTDVYPYGGQICFNDYANGWNDLPYSFAEFTPPPNGLCDGGGGTAVDNDPNVFAITIDVIKVKKGTVELTYTTE